MRRTDETHLRGRKKLFLDPREHVEGPETVDDSSSNFHEGFGLLNTSTSSRSNGGGLLTENQWTCPGVGSKMIYLCTVRPPKARLNKGKGGGLTLGKKGQLTGGYMLITLWFFKQFVHTFPRGDMLITF